MREYALVFCVAAAVTFLLTPVIRRVAIRWGAMAAPRDRDVHTIPVPRLGGVAMLGGFAAAMLVARRMPTLQRTFTDSSQVTAVLLAAVIICVVGVLDDRYELDALTKFAGQIVAAGPMVLLGVQYLLFYLPFGGIGTLLLSRDEAVPLTIIVAVVTVNAVNFIDGLDGLAAGVVGISALAFFAYSYHLGKAGYDVAFAPTLICAAVAGICIGFLPHNFSPARIIMGDSGSMLLGLLLAAAQTSATTADSQTFKTSFGSLPLLLPLVILVAVLAVPFVDLILAVVRRVKAGRSPFSPDKKHLHHRLLEIGHSQRRAVLLIYFWAAVVAFGGVAVSLVNSVAVVVSLVGSLALVAVILSSVPRLRSLRRPGK
ncbi:MAG: glycosyltransferase family 4 protein [Mycobacteriales bacterium]